MLQRRIAILTLAIACFAQAVPNLAGTWSFTHDNNRISGTIVLRQSGDHFIGTWHTSQGKTEPDTTVSARLYGSTLMLTRMIDKNNLQNYILTLSSDGKHLDGYGQGWSLNHTDLNMTKIADAPASKKLSERRPAQNALPVQNAASPPQPNVGLSSAATHAKKQTWMGIGVPPSRGTYSWVIQSVAASGEAGKKYSSFYYEVSTGRSVEEPLSLPAGGEIVGVFPDDCTFSVQDQSGHSFIFRNESEARARGLVPGTWSVYPLKCGGIAVYIR